MAINTTVEPFVQRMLQQPDPRIGAELVSGTVNNFMGAYLARKDVERDEEEKAANDPTYQKQSGFQRFSRGFLGAPGMIEEGRQPFSVQRRSAAERETTLNRQIDSLLKDPKALADEIGNLTPDQIPDWIQKNAGLAANPIGKSMLDAAGRAYSSTKQAQIQAGRARHLGELAELFPNIDVTTPEGLAQAQKNLSVKELYNRARIEGRSLNQLPDDWFNPDGTINEQKAVPGMGSLPRSEALQSRQEIAAMREALIGQRSQLDRDLRERKITLDEYNALARNVDRQLRGLSLGVEIQNLPAPPFGSTAPIQQAPIPTQPGAPGFEPMAPMIVPPQEPPASPTFKPVERPLTTGTATQLQKDNIMLDGAISALSRAQKVVQEVPEAFGIGGIGRELFETATGQINPNAPAKVSKARQEAGLAFVEVADMLRTDSGNMSRYEQERLRELGDIRDWKDYPERAAQKLDSINKMVIAKKLRIAKALKSKIDDNLLRSIPSSEVIGLGSSGLLTEEEAQRWYRLNKQK